MLFSKFFQVKHNYENMHHCFTANNIQCPDADVERSLGIDEKWGKIMQTIIYFM